MLLNTLIIFIRIISNSALNTGQKRLSVNTHSSVINFNTYFLLTIISLPLFLIFYNSVLLQLNTMLWAFIGGIFGALGNLCLISALKRGELSILGPINSYKSVVSLVFAFFLLKETPSLLAIFGIILIIIGSYFIFDTTKEGFHIKVLLRYDIQLRLLALILTAIEAVFIKKVIVLTDPLCSFCLWAIFGCLFSFLILKSSCKGKLLLPKRFAPLSALVLLMQGSTNLIFSRIPVAPALALFQLSSLLNVFLGWKIFKECDPLKKLIGSSIMVIGSIVIILNS